MSYRLLLLILFILALAGCTGSGNQPLPARAHSPLGVDLEATSQELEAAAALLPEVSSELMSEDDLKLEVVIAAGKRNLEWIQILSKNQAPGETPLSLSKKATVKISITSPTRYNAQTTLAEFEKIKTEMPSEMKAVLLEGAAFTAKTPVEIETYLKYAGNLDTIYQTAVRWKSYLPYLKDMANYRRWDIRGYYFLKDRQNLGQELDGWNSLPAEVQAQLQEWLLISCYSTVGSDEKCAQELTEHVKENTVGFFYQKYLDFSEYVYSQYFDIPETREEFVWTADQPLKMIVPFKTPSNLKLKEALRLNIQDEWRWLGWQLELKFMPSAAVHVAFEEGAVPNVNGEAGDTITMDANAPLTEEAVKFALRHEFGHVLGFPDCYLEFFDETDKTIVSYQIDPTDVMCSRSGKIKERHFNALKAAYYRE